MQNAALGLWPSMVQKQTDQRGDGFKWFLQEEEKSDIPNHSVCLKWVLAYGVNGNCVGKIQKGESMENLE